MLNRIQKIMDDKGLTVSSLADEIGVKRPTMTHTLSGRNNPSLDIISKILERFPEVSSDWLMFGKEPIYRSTTPIQQALFEEFPSSSEVRTEQPATYQTKQMVNPPPSPVSITMKEDVRNEPKSEINRKIERIMVFYSDNSFETFVPESTSKK